MLTAATVFLEIWKRQRARVVLHWDLYGWDEEEVRWGQRQQGGLFPVARVAHTSYLRCVW